MLYREHPLMVYSNSTVRGMMMYRAGTIGRLRDHFLWTE